MGELSEPPDDLSTLPLPASPEAASLNVELDSKPLLGSVLNHALAYNTATKHLYVGFRSAFAVLNLSNQAQPVLVGWLELGTGASVRGLSYPGTGNHVYVAAYGAGVLKVDVSTPSAPVLSGSYDPGGFTNDLFVVGNYAYLADSYTVKVVDTTSMTLVTTYDTPGTANDIFVLGNTAYVADRTSLQILNITTIPPTLLGSVPIAGGQATGVWVNEDFIGNIYVFLADSGGTDLRIIDATVPASAAQIGTFDADGVGSDVTLDSSGTTAYLANTTGGLRVVDVSAPNSPVAITSYDTPGSATGVLMAGASVLVADQDSVQILNVAGVPPVLLGRYLCGAANGIVVRNGIAYIGGAYGMTTLDVSVPEHPRALGRSEWAGCLAEQSHAVEGLAVSGDYAYSIGLGYFSIDDISVPASPVQVYCGWGSGTDVVVEGNYAYIASLSNGLLKYFVSIPASPTLVGQYNSPGTAYGVAVSAPYAYVADYTSGVAVLDVSAETPALVTTLSTPGNAYDVAVAGHYLYVAEQAMGLEIYDIEVPGSPVWVGQFNTEGSAYRVAVAGGLAYVADDMAGLRVLDISTPWVPIEVGYYDTDQNVKAVALQGGYAFIGAQHDGAYLLHYTGACFDAYEVNDSFEEAYPVAAGNLYDSILCTATDYDYYAMHLWQGGTINAVLHPPTGLDYDLFLYSPSQSLLLASMNAGDATESVSYTTPFGGVDYYFLVRGHDGTQFSATQFYSLVPTIVPCPGPTLPVYIYMGRRDANNNAVFDVQDPNQPSTRTGYNLFRADAPEGPFTCIVRNMVDMDEGTANIQLVDVNSSTGGPYYYQVKAFNGSCGAEGP